MNPVDLAAWFYVGGQIVGLLVLLTVALYVIYVEVRRKWT